MGEALLLIDLLKANEDAYQRQLLGSEANFNLVRELFSSKTLKAVTSVFSLKSSTAVNCAQGFL